VLNGREASEPLPALPPHRRREIREEGGKEEKEEVNFSSFETM